MSLCATEISPIKLSGQFLPQQQRGLALLCCSWHVKSLSFFVFLNNSVGSNGPGEMYRCKLY